MDFTILDKLAQRAADDQLPAYRISVWIDGEIREKVITPANDCNDIYSVSKNYITTACGFCIDDGYMDYSTTVWDLFHDERDLAPQWKDVTLEMVLSQTIGISGMFLDIDTEAAFSWEEEDWLDRVLNHPFVYTPGEKFAYSDSNFYLASRMAAKASGRYAEEILNERLFVPMKMQGWAWSKCPKGHIMGGTGLFIRTRDMAKLGALYLNEGVYEGKRILSEEFCYHATHAVSHPHDNSDYGLSFWIPKNHSNPPGRDVFRGSGMLNQSFWVDRGEGFVAAWHAYDTKGRTNDAFADVLMNL